MVLLKGVGSVLCYPNESLAIEAKDVKIDVCTEGNPGMASGGMGDILGGVIAGLIAQGLSNVDALRCAVVIHGEAADLAAEAEGERGLLASDLLPYIRRLANAHPNRSSK
jgi:NAD(P)H-hydrate epimerase